MRVNLSEVVVPAAALAIVLAFAYLHRKRRVSPHESKASPPATVKWEHHACRLPKRSSADDRKAIRSSISLAHRERYFELSCCRITSHAEQRMEQISSIVTKEYYNDHWADGIYRCAKCSRPLYDSSAKFVGPCLWPSFRAPHGGSSLHAEDVPPGAYNQYACAVREVYCGADDCRLFLGHCFEDGRACGDTHPDAGWRHCVLSLSLDFAARSNKSN